jgi:biotin-(acetyl-CoA carboxylase) ligase
VDDRICIHYKYILGAKKMSIVAEYRKSKIIKDVRASLIQHKTVWIKNSKAHKISGMIHAISPDYGITLSVGKKHLRHRVEIDNIRDYGVV